MKDSMSAGEYMRMDGSKSTAHRTLGKTGVRVSPLSLAAWSVRASGGGPSLTPDDVERAFHLHGIDTFFLTWQMTAMAEGVRRLVKAGHRDRLTLITMASFPTGALVRRAFERNARELGVDSFDVFLIGWVQARWYLTGKTWAAMRELTEAGKVRAIGFSSHDRVMAERLAREFGPDVLMVRYNAAHRGAEREIFAPLGDDLPGVIAYTATRWGMLLEPRPEAGFPHGMTAAECYRFALSNPAVDTVLCAPRSTEELDADVSGVATGQLDPARMAEVRRFGDAVHAASRGGRRWMFRQG